MKSVLCLASLSILFVLLTSCRSQVASAPTELPVSTPTSYTAVPPSAIAPIAITPSSLPTQPITPMITPDPNQLERWKEYQTELAKSFLPYLPPEEVLCEWEILGQSELEVYVWAICTGTIGIGGLEDPAVIHLGIDGTVQQVEIPGPGTHYASDIRKLFPDDIQARIFSHSIDYTRLSAHLQLRREHPNEPPLVVLSATPAP